MILSIVALLPLIGMWFISYQTNISLTEEKVDQHQNIKAISLLLATLLTVLAISSAVSRRLTVSIRELTAVADHYSAGS